MGERLSSSMEGRLQAHRRDLVIDLHTRHGMFWENVQLIRSRNQVVAEPAMPPELEPDDVYRPTHLKPIRGKWLPNHEPEVQEWMAWLVGLHDAIVPVDLHIETPNASSHEFWMGFLSGCVLFDPPPEELLRFADHHVAAFGEFVNPLDPWGDEDTPQMLAPPIRFVTHPDVMVKAERDRQDWLIRRLDEKLREPGINLDGIDLTEMAAHLDYIYRATNTEADPSSESRPYITVDEHTTEQDVRNAFRLMAAKLPSRPRAARPLRDRLTCLQCAVWYYECGWSHEQIATEMGWAIQRSAHAKPRCETARQYIAEGRSLLSQRMVAA
jgi:hypothetical protein